MNRTWTTNHSMYCTNFGIPVVGSPNCLQTTWASAVSQKSSQTVPQTLLLHISTRPSDDEDPPTSLRAP